MAKNNSKGAKSTRKPLVNISNGEKSLKPSSDNTKKVSPQQEERQDEVLDRLLLAHSDLSNIIHQIDELVVQAFKVKLTRKKERKEIESFSNVLSDIHSSLKAWVPRFQKALSSPSIEPVEDKVQSFTTKPVSTATEKISNVADSPEPLESLVSPSPLVSWCADRTAESGRQLFLLTPLPRSKVFSSKCHGSSRSVFERITHLDEPPAPFELPSSSVTEVENTVDCGFVSPPKILNRERSVLLMTPRLKMSPPKSCVLLEPISESSHHDFNDLRKSTPYPLGSKYCSPSEASEPSSSQASESLAWKYPELFGTKQTQRPGTRRTVKETSMNWLTSPPKSCVLMEPPEEQLSYNLFTKDDLCSDQMLNQPTSLTAAREKEFQAAYKATAKSCNEESPIANATVVESTPMWKDPGSVIHTGKRLGENTLKKELWTRFEAASSNMLHLDVSVMQEASSKGFLDLLEEVSCER